MGGCWGGAGGDSSGGGCRTPGGIIYIYIYIYIYTCIHTHTHIWIHMTGHVGGLAYHHSFIDIHHYLHTDDGGIPTRVLMTLYNPGLSCVFIHIFTIRWFHIYGESQCFSFRSIFMFVIYKKPWHHGFHSFNHQNSMISGMAMAPLLSAQPSPRTRLPNPKSRPPKSPKLGIEEARNAERDNLQMEGHQRLLHMFESCWSNVHLVLWYFIYEYSHIDNIYIYIYIW